MRLCLLKYSDIGFRLFNASAESCHCFNDVHEKRGFRQNKLNELALKK